MPDKEEKQFSRREFVTGVGGLGAGALFGGLFLKGTMMPDKVLAIPASEGLIDPVGEPDKPFVTGYQVLAAGADGQVRQGIIDRSPGQHQGQHNDGPAAPT